MRPRLFSQRLDPGVLRLYRLVLGFFLLVFLGMIWPVATVFSRVYPLVFGLPFSLFYIATLLVLSFLRPPCALSVGRAHRQLL